MPRIVDRSFPEVIVVADGASIHTRRLLRALVERDVRVELATFESAGVDGVVEHRLAPRRLPMDLRYLVGVIPLARLIRARHPSVVHAHYVSSYGVMTAAAYRLTDGIWPRLVQTVWGTDLLARRRTALSAFALRTADLVTGDSAGLEREARRLAPAMRWHRFVFGPPAALLDADDEREPLVVSMRRLDPDMRVDVVARAFRLARQVAPAALTGWRLLVAGGGSAEGQVREAARGDASIDVAGPLDQPELHRRIARARVQVAVPRSDSTSAALLDGLAAGLIPIVNDLEGPREWVDGSIGEIVPRDPTVDDVAAAIVRAAMRDVPRERIRARVRDVVWDREVDALVAAYRTLLPP